MRNFVKSIDLLLGYVRLLIFVPGLALVAVCTVGGIAYLRGVLGDTTMQVDLTEAITGENGMFAYYWIGLFIGWVILECIHWVVKLHGWWLHRAEIKSEVFREGEWVKATWERIRGNTE